MSERPISRGRSLAPVRVWIDDPNPVYRRGLACCLVENGYVVAGESCGLIPEPGPGAADVLIFDLGDPVIAWGVVDAGRPLPRLVGVALAAPCGRLSMAELDSVVVRSDLTPATILAIIARAVAAPGRRA